ncbi:MAG: DNA primase [Symploca sp. SIO2E9]|nr:DNA primase [Symploca sp. SIO2E9]
MRELKSFDIRQHLDKLTPIEGRKNRFVCPSCAENNLTVDPKSGKYKCWNGCECRDIREAIAPWDEAKGVTTPTRQIHAKAKRGEAQKVTTAAPAKPIRPKSKRYFEYSAVNSSGELQRIRVVRIDDGTGKKTIWQQHWSGDGWENGLSGIQLDSIDLYRQAEAEEAIARGEPLFVVEGEPIVDLFWDLGIAAVTNIGGSGKPFNPFLLLKAPIVILCPDQDKPGLKHMNDIRTRLFNHPGVKWLLAFPESKLWGNLPENHGVDALDWIQQNKLCKQDILNAVMTSEEFCEKVGNQLITLLRKDKGKANNGGDDEGSGGSPGDRNDGEVPDSFNPTTESNQLLFSTLYGDKPWICVGGELYCWTGTHYQHREKGAELKRIADFCNTYAVFDPKAQEMRYPYAHPRKAKEVLEWVKMRLYVDPNLTNPPGLNCTNGILNITWEGSTPSWELLPHNPSTYFLYKPLIKYDPEADPKDCDRLLEALDEPQRNIFLKTIAASLDLREVRKYKGRGVRAILARGTGSNGKDALREVVSLMYGRQGLTAATLSDFVSYDNGRKFTLAKLRNSRINWASENSDTTRLDKIQSLKALITGETISIERKGQDEFDIAPTCVPIFNVNDLPRLTGSLEAITSRYAILNFHKTFSDKPNAAKNEILADPRYKYDQNFVQSEVAPAFLNKVLDALESLMGSGIDYSCVQDALKEVRAENCHLFDFAEDTGLGEHSDGLLTAAQIWERLRQWYVENGTLEMVDAGGSIKHIWHEQARPGDRNVKACNQVLARIGALFPKAKIITIAHPNGGKKGIRALQGIGFLSEQDDPPQFHPNSTPIPPQQPPQETTQNQGFHPTHPKNLTLEKKEEEKFIGENQSNDDLDPPTTPCNVGIESQEQIDIEKDQEMNKNTCPQLGWVGCEDRIAGKTGVGDWGATGVETPDFGVGEEQNPEIPLPLGTDSVTDLNTEECDNSMPRNDSETGDRPISSGLPPLDYSIFPAPEEMPLSERFSLAHEIKARILGIRSGRDYTQLRRSPDYSSEQLNFVMKSMLTQGQRDAIKSLVEKPHDDTRTL